jgi:hypothetical protein
MVEMDELIIVATDDEPVRRYLRRMGICEFDITQYVAWAQSGEAVSISFGTDGEGATPPLRLRCPDRLAFELTAPSAD